MFWDNPKFKRLQQEWYSELNKQGFTDIEVNHETLQDKSPDIYKEENAYKNSSEIVRQAKLEYHLLLSRCVSENECDSELDFFVMAGFVEGWSNKKIVDKLKELGHERHRKTVMFIRRKYENRWGIRKWRPDQLKSITIPYKKKA